MRIFNFWILCPREILNNEDENCICSYLSEHRISKQYLIRLIHLKLKWYINILTNATLAHT